MASNDQIDELRGMIAEPDNVEPYTLTKLGALIDAKGTTLAAAVDVWRRKAASYAELVNTSENGSSRQNGDLYKQAISMANMYQAEIDASNPITITAQASRTRKIVRG